MSLVSAPRRSARVAGRSRNCTSWNTSVRRPPIPIIRQGPKCSSLVRPAINSTPRPHHLFNQNGCPGKEPAGAPWTAVCSVYPVSIPSLTAPRSVLCASPATRALALGGTQILPERPRPRYVDRPPPHGATTPNRDSIALPVVLGKEAHSLVDGGGRASPRPSVPDRNVPLHRRSLPPPPAPSTCTDIQMPHPCPAQSAERGGAS